MQAYCFYEEYVILLSAFVHLAQKMPKLHFAVIGGIMVKIIFKIPGESSMKISTSTFGVIQPYGMEEGLKTLVEAGFEAIDYSITQNAMNWEEELFQDPFNPAFAAHFKAIAKTVRDSGLEMHQCHAPYASESISDPVF